MSVLVWYAQRYKARATTRYFQALMLLCAAWTLLYGLEMSLDDLAGKHLLFQMRWVPQAFVSVGILALAMSYARKGKPLSAPYLIPLAAVPLVTSVLALTGGGNQWFKYGFSLDSSGPFVVLLTQSGPWFYIHAFYSYGLIVAALLLIAVSARGDKPFYRSQSGLLIAAIVIPLAADVLYQLGTLPVVGFNPMPSAFSITGIVLLWGLNHYGLLDLRPMARQAVVEEMPDPVLVLDQQHRLIDFNRAARDRFRLQEGSPLGQRVENVLADQTEFARRLDRDGEFRAELDIGTGNDRRFFEASVRPVGPAEEGGGKIVLLRDVTDRREAEDRLRAGEARYRHLIELAPFPIVIASMEGALVLMNQACQVQFRLTPEEVSTRRAREFYVHPEDRERLLAGLEEGGAISDRELQLRKGDGESFWAHISASIIHLDGQPHVFLAFNDINERRQASEALKMANSKLNLLSSITRHDLLNNLTAMRGYVQLARMDPSPEKLSGYLERLDRITERAETLISFTSDYQDLGVAAPTWQGIDDILVKAAGQLDLGAIQLAASTTGVKVLADPLLEKVFYNLMENAIRHGGTVTRIALSWTTQGGDLVLRFEDDGAGVAASDKERIFERGFGKNTGLGLFLCREDHLLITGMQIHERGQEGEGARFEIIVPAQAYRLEGEALNERSRP